MMETERNIKKIIDVMSKYDDMTLWCRAWVCKGYHVGLSFHKTYSAAKAFRPDSCKGGLIVLVPVSQWLMDQVMEFGDYWANFHSMELAKYYVGPSTQ